MNWYELNCGQFVLFRDGIPYTAPADVIALAFEVDDSGRITLHKHGNPESVSSWVTNSRDKLASAGAIGKEMADALQVVDVRVPIDPSTSFPLHILNAAINRDQNALRYFCFPDSIVNVESRVVEDAPRFG